MSKKRFTKQVSFHTENDKELIEYAKRINFSGWVKDQIKKEIENEMQSLRNKVRSD